MYLVLFNLPYIFNANDIGYDINAIDDEVAVASTMSSFISLVFSFSVDGGDDSERRLASLPFTYFSSVKLQQYHLHYQPLLLVFPL